MRLGKRLRVQLKSVAAAVLLGSAYSLVGCTTVPSDLRIGLDEPNASEPEFGPVANFLDHRCGSLDCHGQVARNLRIFGCEGMRLEVTDIPQCSRLLGGRPTTPAEHQATYRSLIGLEPTVMSFVVDHQGQDPELLTFVRKARGTESHKGGALIVPGDPQDYCITSWLAGNVNTTACATAIGFPVFPSLSDAAAE